ncbi:MAG: FmdB family zinc ribbon protein [Chloroflexia bacterium]
MPIYEYECKSCGTRFDKMQPIHAEPLVVCLNCGEGPIRRVYQPVGVIFKGSGWYITDNRNSNKKEGDSKSAPSESGDKGDSAGTSTTKIGTETDTKTDTKARDTPAPSSPSSGE